MAPPRQRARTSETPNNKQLAQSLQHLTQTMQILSEALLHNNHPAPPPQPAGHRDVGRLVSGQRPPMFASEEDPVMLEDWIRTFDKIFSVVKCPVERRVEYEEFLHLQQGSSSVVEYHKRFLELARFARMLVPTELAKVEKFVTRLNYEARKALTVSMPRTLKEAYLSAADLYRVQQLQWGSFELARKRNESGGPHNFKKPRQDFRAKTAPSPPQGSTRAVSGDQAKTFACRRCGKEHVGKDCQGQAHRCFKCGERGHKAPVCPLQANQKVLPPSSGSGGTSRRSSSRGVARARPSGRVFVMGRS
ncbi:PREDICTED: uncharacterized protein LOC109179356 [Ipomoea nil]|uniref:uncharacterized protein LOC109179356 n=1 Tax=Ipomoea nil TaxID=35883 RepID=UPI000901E737|nr:PREDICTED: uncharacterized protein LOC109179356 [Ipomoea nil]